MPNSIEAQILIMEIEVQQLFNKLYYYDMPVERRIQTKEWLLIAETELKRLKKDAKNNKNTKISKP
jgi:hypothetical protein